MVLSQPIVIHQRAGAAEAAEPVVHIPAAERVVALTHRDRGAVRRAAFDGTDDKAVVSPVEQRAGIANVGAGLAEERPQRDWPEEARARQVVDGEALIHHLDDRVRAVADGERLVRRNPAAAHA